jgi:excisionase family DNA binding protein
VKKITALIGIERAAKILGVSVHTLRTWTSRRKVPFIKLRRRVLFDPEKLREFIEKNSILPQ